MAPFCSSSPLTFPLRAVLMKLTKAASGGNARKDSCPLRSLGVLLAAPGSSPCGTGPVTAEASWCHLGSFSWNCSDERILLHVKHKTKQITSKVFWVLYCEEKIIQLRIKKQLHASRRKSLFFPKPLSVTFCLKLHSCPGDKEIQVRC